MLQSERFDPHREYLRRWLPELELGILAEQPQERVVARGDAATALIVGATLAVALLTAAIAAVVTRRITRPIVQLTATASWMARGDLSRRVEVARRDEIGLLAGAFNHMAAELQILYANLEARVAERTAQLAAANEQARYHARQLAISAQVAGVASSIRDLPALLGTSGGRNDVPLELWQPGGTAGSPATLVARSTADVSNDALRDLMIRSGEIPAGQEMEVGVAFAPGLIKAEKPDWQKREETGQVFNLVLGGLGLLRGSGRSDRPAARRDDGQPGLPQRCRHGAAAADPLAAHTARRDGHRHL